MSRPLLRIYRPSYRRLRLTVAGAVLLGLVSRIFLARESVSAASTGPSFIEFDSGPVRPIAISPNGQTLFAANTPNGTLEVFDLTSGTPAFSYRVAVGLEPVAVAARNNTELRVVNHLSDSVSIVSLVGTPHVTPYSSGGR